MLEHAGAVVLTVLDPLAVGLAALLVLPDPTPGLLVLAALTAALVCRGAGLQRSRLRFSVVEDLPALLLAAVAVSVVVAGWRSAPHVSVGRLVLLAGLGFAVAVLLRTAAYAVTHLLRLSGLTARPVVVVGVGAVGRRLADALLVRREHGLVPVAMVDSSDLSSARGLPLPLAGGLEDLEEVLDDLGVRDVIFALPEAPEQDAVAAAWRCVRRDRQVYVVPRSVELARSDRHHRRELVRDIALVRLHRPGQDRLTRAARRTVDVAVALLGLVALTPVLLLLALAVRLEVGAGVLYQQTRVVEGGGTFTLLKFRTARPVRFGDGATTWSIDNDRIGPVGRFLRRTGLDELPRLVTVLRGELSLVGPPGPRAGGSAGVARTPAPPRRVGWFARRTTRRSTADSSGPRHPGLRHPAPPRPARPVPAPRTKPEPPPAMASGPPVSAAPPPTAGRPSPEPVLSGPRRG